MRVEWHASAIRDADNIVDHISLDRPAAARKMIARIQKAVLRLQSYPFSGRSGKLAETKELVVPGTPYVVIYSVEAADVNILRVLHAAQRWPPAED